MAGLTRRALWFDAPGELRVREESYACAPGDAHVRVCASLVSSGTERLVLAGRVDPTVRRDAHLSALDGSFTFPFKYGYCAVGELLESVGELQRGARVFAFQPHHSHFAAPVSELWPLAPGTSIEEALLWPSVETAIALLHDAAPIVGERVLVIGHGLIGTCVTSLLRALPLTLVVMERGAGRATLARARGLDVAQAEEEALARLGGGADLVIELSGDAASLACATRLAAREGRVVVGSWYGDRDVAVALGTSFHRKQLRLVASQVSEIPGALSSRWDKARRFAVTQAMARRIEAGMLVTHHVALARASEAFTLLADPESHRLGVALTYEDG